LNPLSYDCKSRTSFGWPKKRLTSPKARSKESMDRCYLGVPHSRSPKDFFLFKSIAFSLPFKLRSVFNKAGPYSSPLHFLCKKTLVELIGWAHALPYRHAGQNSKMISHPLQLRCLFSPSLATILQSGKADPSHERSYTLSTSTGAR
jgi:hypothetical protein